MSFQTWLALAAMAVTPVAAHGQPDYAAPSGREASPTAYQSAFAGYKAFAEEEDTPDTRWRSLNRQMGELGGHAAHMNADSTAHDTSASRSRPASAAPKADLPVDHGKHH